MGRKIAELNENNEWIPVGGMDKHSPLLPSTKKEVVDNMKKLLTQMMNIVGIVFLSAFAMVGAITYYSHPLVNIEVPIIQIIVATTVVIFLWLMVAVEEWD